MEICNKNIIEYKDGVVEYITMTEAQLTLMAAFMSINAPNVFCICKLTTARPSNAAWQADNTNNKQNNESIYYLIGKMNKSFTILKRAQIGKKCAIDVDNVYIQHLRHTK